MTGLIFVTVLATSIWVAVDASNLGAPRDRNLGVAGSSPLAWGLACIVMWIVFFPLYLAKRPRIRAAGLEHRHGTMRQSRESVAAGEKECPRCAETIKARALVCRFCGAELTAASPPRPPEPLGRIFSDEARVEAPGR